MKAQVVIGRFALTVLAIFLVLVIQSRVIKDDVGNRVSASNPSSSFESPDVSPDISPTPEPTPTSTPEPYADRPDIQIDSWEYAVVNYRQPVGASFVPKVSSTLNGQYFDSRAVNALEEFLTGAGDAGLKVYISAAYRPYSSQATLFFGKASQIAWGGAVEYAEAEELAKEYVAYPGTSDHQLGLGADILDKYYQPLPDDFDETELGKWLAENCAQYGFILRYPMDKEDETGFKYEPWHFRYVGKEAAEYITKNGLCLEEFVNLYY